MKSRNRSEWVLEPESRKTINEKIGGALYDFVDSKKLPQSDGTHKALLSCLREESGMNDKTLQHVFKGITDSLAEYERVIVSICELDVGESRQLLLELEKIVLEFALNRGDEFLEYQRILHRPKRKPPPVMPQSDVTRRETMKLSDVLITTNIYRLWKRRKTAAGLTSCSFSIHSDLKRIRE